MKAETHTYLRNRLARLEQELRLAQEMRERVASDPCLGVERRGTEIGYFDAIIRWLLEGAERLEVTLNSADVSP